MENLFKPFLISVKGSKGGGRYVSVAIARILALVRIGICCINEFNIIVLKKATQRFFI
jgi:hypothetical protein